MRRSREIGTPTRGRRLVQREPVDTTSWVFMKLLREQDDTRMIYKADPFVEVYRLRDHIYGLFTISVDGMRDPQMYLIVGPEKALLIDTDLGIGNLKGLAEQLTDEKPVMTASTHCSFDHSYGNCQFEQCLCRENEATQTEEKQDPHIWDYLFNEQGNDVWLDIHRESVITYREYEVIPVPDQYQSDLGDGYEVELVRVPGHKPGHVIFPDKRSRLLFTEDNIISMRVGIGKNSTFATVGAYEKEIRKLATGKEEFDYIFPGHSIFNSENIVVNNLVETAGRILSNSEGYGVLEESRERATRLKYVKELGTIGYGEDSVYGNREVEG